MNNSSVKIPKDLMLQYVVAVYLLQPFYIDNRGKKIRKNIRKFLSISENQEKNIMECLLKEKIILRVGDLIYVDKKMKEDIKKLIDSKKININDLIKIV